MIIEHEPRSQLPILGIAVALLVWFGGMTMAALILKPAAIVAFGEPIHLLQAGAETDGNFLDAGRSFVILRTGRADSVLQLYARGAWLVWPVINAGCKGKTANL